MKRVISAVIFAAVLKTLALADIPRTLNYQGYLKNGDGTPVTAATAIRFSLYSSNPARSNPVWSESRTVTPDNGIYSVQLGTVTPITADFAVPYHLGIRVGTDPEMPLQPLASVPYALNSVIVPPLSLNYTSTTTPTIEATSSGNVGVKGYSVSNTGVWGIGGAYGVDGVTETGTGVLGRSTSGYGVMGTTGNNIAVYGVNISTGAPAVEGWNKGSGDIFRGWSGENPALQFRVTGSGNMVLSGAATTGPVSASSPGNVAVTGTSTTNTGVWGIGVTGVDGLSTSGIGTVGRSTSGIGVKGVTGSNIGVYGVNNSTGVPALEGWNQGTGDIIRGWSGGSPVLRFSVAANGNLSTSGSMTAAGLTIGTNQLVANGGWIGIGTASPGARLHLKGNGWPDSFMYLDTTSTGKDSGLRFYENGTVGAHLFWGAADQNLKLYGKGYSGIDVTSTGNVGIGTGTPADKLHVAGNYLRVEGAGGEKAYIGGDGAGSDVQIGSMNAAITNVAMYNPVSSQYMSVYLKDVHVMGGADLAEPFDSMETERLEPGMVVAIDPVNPGKLVLTDKPYDRKVAGIVSGANGIRPGVTMGQEGSAASGTVPVALTGRVYVRADASEAAIEPGDLLTSSATPGHAMKVVDHGKGQGAIIGKAMSRLNSGTGLVLVLVSLQ